MSFADLGGLGNAGWRGALRVAQHQTPLRGERLGEGGRRPPAEAGVWDTATVGMVYAGFGILTLIGNFTMPMALARIGSSRALMRIALVFVLAAIAVTYVFDGLAPALVLLALAIWAMLGGIGAPGLQTHIAQLSPTRRGALMALAGSRMNLGVAGATALASSVYPTGAVWVALVALVLIAIAMIALRPARPGVAEPASTE